MRRILQGKNSNATRIVYRFFVIFCRRLHKVTVHLEKYSYPYLLQSAAIAVVEHIRNLLRALLGRYHTRLTCGVRGWREFSL